MSTGTTFDNSDLFQQIEAYPWAADREFQLGLRSILGNAQSTAQAAELELRARCFFFARKTGRPTDFEAYKNWVTSRRSESSTSSSAAVEEVPNGHDDTDPSNLDSRLPSSNDPNSLAAILDLASRSGNTVTEASDDNIGRLSYADIVEMIQTGKEIPGIKQIPTTILEGQSSDSTQSRRRKPWEKEGGTDPSSVQA